VLNNRKTMPYRLRCLVPAHSLLEHHNCWFFFIKLQVSSDWELFNYAYYSRCFIFAARHHHNVVSKKVDSVITACLINKCFDQVIYKVYKEPGWEWAALDYTTIDFHCVWACNFEWLKSRGNVRISIYLKNEGLNPGGESLVLH
jgi:hypothetical protein